MRGEPKAWSPADATHRINECGRNDHLSISFTLHAKERMAERGLIMADLLHLLKTGFVYQEAEPSSRDGLFKYKIEGPTPNSDGRTVCAVVIPGSGCAMKIVTVMWRDEK
ncbi:MULTISPECIES: DUF4258 domain-containing protein [Hyphobacterium]|uniref:DUF4258 domain-containing protein n=1 Tax=Hyphobacterium vulgare TaxID=1736751 RepID=A0ABV6ZUU4_9PROT